MIDDRIKNLVKIARDNMNTNHVSPLVYQGKPMIINVIKQRTPNPAFEQSFHILWRDIAATLRISTEQLQK